MISTATVERGYRWGLIDLPLRALPQSSYFIFRVAWSILDCARRTSTFLSCVFREQEDDQAALPILPRPRAARARSPSCTPLESVPFERSLLPGIPESDEQDEKKDDHFYKPQQAE